MFLLEKDISFLLILLRIPVLVIICCVGKWDDHLLHSECFDLSERGGTSARDSEISIREEMSNIFLRDPLERLRMIHLREGILHVTIEFPERDNPFVVFASCEPLGDSFEYRPCPLASADDEDVRLIGFPAN
jgi:hypothetical protein